MGGFSNITGDPLGTIVNADNVSFDGTARGAPITTDGQLLIGSTTTPHIRVGTLTSLDSSVTITPGHGTIDLSAAGGGGGITTIDGDNGYVTGATVSIEGGYASANSGTMHLDGDVGHTTLALKTTDSNHNTCLGTNSFNSTSTGVGNCALGENTLSSSTSSTYCIGIGYNALFSQQANYEQIAIGHNALALSVTDATNIAIGQNAMYALSGGSSVDNVGMGRGSLINLISGSNNTCLGYQTGQYYTAGESHNVLLGSGTIGVAGEYNTLRIGNSSNQSPGTLGAINAAYICGINGNTTASPVFVTVDTVTNQLGISSGSGGTPINFFAYASNTLNNVTGNSVIYTIQYDTTLVNVGGGYNTGTGIFTAPRAGFYSFSATCFVTGFTSGSALILSTLSNTCSFRLFQDSTTTAVLGNIMLNGSWQLYMDQNDTMAVQVFSDNVGQTVNLYSAAPSAGSLSGITCFSGALLS